MENEKVILTNSQICYVFNIVPETLRKWTKNGCPKLGRGKYDLRSVINWRGLSVQGDVKDVSSEAKKLQAEADFKHAKARQEEIRLQEMLGQLIPVEMVHDRLEALFTDIRQTLLNLPEQIRSEVHTLYPEASGETSEIADRVVRKVLTGLAGSNNTSTGISLDRTTKKKRRGRTKSI